MSRPQNIKINGDKLRKEVEKSTVDMPTISSMVLHKNDCYLRDCLRDNNISEEPFKLLCSFLKIKKEDYILKGSTEPEKNDTDDLIIGINRLVNLQNSILAELKSQTLLLRSIEGVSRSEVHSMGELNKKMNENTEKVKAIFTEVKFKKM